MEQQQSYSNMKEKLIEAINATIVPNDEKAITAESLANLLIEMVEAMGEGGTGAGHVSFYIGVPNVETLEFVLTPEQKAHNAEMVKIVKESPVSITASTDIVELLKLEMPDMDFSGAKYNIPADAVIYVNTVTAGTFVLPHEGVAFESQGSIFLFAPDGSVTLLEG
jgi:hypothetical protein